MFWDMEDERTRRGHGPHPLLRVIARAARWEMQRPILDGPFTETKEIGLGRVLRKS